MSVSAKRRQEIYSVVSNRLMDLRIEVAKKFNGHKEGTWLDDKLYRAQCDAADLAVRAADPSKPTKRNRA